MEIIRWRIRWIL